MSSPSTMDVVDEAADIKLRDRLKALNEQQENYEHVRNEIRRLCKTVKSYAGASSTLDEFGFQFADQLQDFGWAKEGQDPYVKQCGATLKQLEAMRSNLNEQLDRLFDPLKQLVDGMEAKASLDTQKAFSQASEAYDDVHKKFNTVKPQKDKAVEKKKMQKMEGDYVEARTNVEKATKDYEAILKAQEFLSKFEMLERVNAHMKSTLQYFAQGHELMKGLEPVIAKMSKDLESARAEYAATRSLSAGGAGGAIDAFALAKPPTDSVAGVRKQGYLFKKSRKVLANKPWNVRWFVLSEDGMLQWYKSWKKVTSKKEPINMLLAAVKPSESGKGTPLPFCFDIVSRAQGTLTVRAMSQQDIEGWMAALSKATAQQLETVQIARDVVGGRSAEEQRAEQRRLFEELRAIDSANCQCADCNTKDPEWASCNLGILICVECSGIHRSMGTHITKVRSLVLDRWDAEQYEIMKLLGNRRANAYWEADLPREFLKPDSSTDRQLKELYISNKYKSKAFVHKLNMPAEHLFQTLYLAAFRGDVLACAQLIAQGADINARNRGDGNKGLLHYLAEEGHRVALEFFLLNGADAQMKDDRGNTAMHLAAARNHGECVRSLLTRVPDAFALEKNADQLTAIDLATQAGHAELAKQIQSRISGSGGLAATPAVSSASTRSAPINSSTTNNSSAPSNGSPRSPALTVTSVSGQQVVTPSSPTISTLGNVIGSSATPEGSPQPNRAFTIAGSSESGKGRPMVSGSSLPAAAAGVPPSSPLAKSFDERSDTSPSNARSSNPGKDQIVSAANVNVSLNANSPAIAALSRSTDPNATYPPTATPQQQQQQLSSSPSSEKLSLSANTVPPIPTGPKPKVKPRPSGRLTPRDEASPEPERPTGSTLGALQPTSSSTSVVKKSGGKEEEPTTFTISAPSNFRHVAHGDMRDVPYNIAKNIMAATEESAKKEPSPEQKKPVSVYGGSIPVTSSPASPAAATSSSTTTAPPPVASKENVKKKASERAGAPPAPPSASRSADASSPPSSPSTASAAAYSAALASATSQSAAASTTSPRDQHPPSQPSRPVSMAIASTFNPQSGITSVNTNSAPSTSGNNVTPPSVPAATSGGVAASTSSAASTSAIATTGGVMLSASGPRAMAEERAVAVYDVLPPRKPRQSVVVTSASSAPKSDQ